MSKKYKYRTTFTVDGVRYDLRADSKRELIEKEIKKRQEIENGKTSIISKNMTVERWADEWLKTYKEPAVSFESLYSYKRIIEKYINSNIGNMPLKNVKPVHIQNIINSMEGMSKARASVVSRMIRQMFCTAVDNDLIPANPAERVALPKTAEKIRRRSITDKERTALLEVCSKDQYYSPLILTLLYTGVRPAELIALQVRHVNFKTGLLTVEQSYKNVSKSIGTTKTPSGRRKIPIVKKLLPVLRKQCENKDPFDYIFLSKTGKPLTHPNLQYIWDDFLKKMNIALGGVNDEKGRILIKAIAPDFIPYCLRHTFCTDLQAAGVPINVAKELMGHSNISITASIYTHSSETATENARRLMDALSSPDAVAK